MIVFAVALSLSILSDAPARPDLEAVALTISIAREDAGPCVAELRAGETEGGRCDVFLINWRAAELGRVSVAAWIDAGRPGARLGDGRRLSRLEAEGDALAREGARILRRIEILTGRE